MPARSQGADQQAVNPFKSRTGSPTFPQCIWEVLVDHRDGISIAAIVEELQQRGLRDVSGLKNPGGQVGGFALKDAEITPCPASKASLYLGGQQLR